MTIDDVADQVSDLLIAFAHGGVEGFRKELHRIAALLPPSAKEAPFKIWECPKCQYRQVDAGSPLTIGH